MDIKQLTIEQAQEVMALFSTSKTNPFDNGMIGKYVIVRCKDAGVHAGILVSHFRRECVLSDARRLWYHLPADRSLSWYEGVSVSGLSDSSKCSGEVQRRHLTESCDIVLCTDTAEQSIRKAPTNEQ